MKKSTVSVLSLVLAGSLCMTTTALAVNWDNHTHPDGTIKIELVNESHSTLKLGGCTSATQVFGPLADVHFTLKENDMAFGKMRHMDKGRFVVQHEHDKHMVPDKKYGSHVTIKKAFKNKDGCVYYKRCTIGAIAGPGKPQYGKWGSLCKNVTIVKHYNDSGTTLYLKAKYHE